MKVLLSGGAGYIGTHIALELMREKYEVVIVDDFSNSFAEAVHRAEELGGAKAKLYEADVADSAAMDDIFRRDKPDAVIHLAGFKAVGESTQKPLMYYRNNLDTTLTLLETMARHGVSNFVFSSSATVYGVPEKSPMTEDMPYGGCTSPYAWTKFMIEQFARDIAFADKAFSAVLLRYFNPIGADASGRIGEDPEGIPNNLMPNITQAAIGRLKTLKVFGTDYPTRDGTGVRDYIHVSDLARGHVAAVEYAAAHKGAELFNLGTGHGISVLEMVRAFERVNGVNIPLEFAPRRPGDIAEYYADSHKAERILGWKAEKTLDDMCRDSWTWQSSNPRGYRG